MECENKRLTRGPELLPFAIDVQPSIQCDSDFKADVIFVVGDVAGKTHDAPCWCLTGSDWFGSVAMRGIVKPGAWSAPLPIGAMVSGALAASEAFKFVMRRLPLRNPSDAVFFAPSISSSWNFDPIAAPLGESIDLGSVDFISAGAISQAALFALSRIPRVEMSGRIFDDDDTEASNLNRNMLTLASDLGQSKVEITSRLCSAACTSSLSWGAFQNTVLTSGSPDELWWMLTISPADGESRKGRPTGSR